MAPRLTRRAQSARELARGLGWFSIGLGLAEVIAPRSLGRMLGVRHPHIWRGFGLREIAAGIGILTSENPEPWVWGRVAGDGLDLASLSTGLCGRDARPLSALAALATVAAVTFVDVYCAQELGASSRPKRIIRNYSTRSGFPEAPERMRGAAAKAISGS
jgi:hypothetical protein